MEERWRRDGGEIKRPSRTWATVARRFRSNTHLSIRSTCFGSSSSSGARMAPL